MLFKKHDVLYIFFNAYIAKRGTKKYTLVVSPSYKEEFP